MKAYCRGGSLHGRIIDIPHGTTSFSRGEETYQHNGTQGHFPLFRLEERKAETVQSVRERKPKTYFEEETKSGNRP